jgi:flavin-dependent dehydrogenase
VGGGTAGLTLANRLSKDNTVAVIEAGGFYEYEEVILDVLMHIDGFAESKILI